MQKTMQKPIKKLFTLSIIFLSTTSFAADHLALVIGNNNYKQTSGQRFDRLANPIRDAETVAAALQKVGFNVTVARNLSRRQFNQSIQNFARRLNRNDIAFIYFAGHGIAVPSQTGGDDYLIPIDANIDVVGNVQYEAINANKMLNSITASGAHTIMVLDACRNNPFARGASRGLRFMENSGSSYIFYSASSGQEAKDDGTFARILAAQILLPQSWESMRFEVTKAVEQASGGTQKPAFLSQLNIDSSKLYFMKQAQMADVSANNQKAQPKPQPVYSAPVSANNQKVQPKPQPVYSAPVSANNQNIQPKPQPTNSDAWMERLWAWADKFRIPAEELPRNKKDLLALKTLMIRLRNVTYLPPEIGQLKNLQTLDLSWNQLQSLPIEIGELKNLQYLYLKDNQLQTLPVEIGQLRNLKSLSLGNNILQHLPTSFSQLKNLYILDIQRNPYLKLTHEQEQFIGRIEKVVR